MLFSTATAPFRKMQTKPLEVSQAYLDNFKALVESGQPYDQVESEPVTGEYAYYGSTDLYGLLYKKHTAATENNISVTGRSDKTTYMLSGRFLGQDGLFRYNSDDYNMKNFRAKGTVQVFPWLRSKTTPTIR